VREGLQGRLVSRLVSLTTASAGETVLVAATRIATAASGFWFVLLATRNLGPVGRGEITVAFSVAWGSVILGDGGVATACRLRLLAGVGVLDRSAHALAAGSMLLVQGSLAGLGVLAFGFTGSGFGPGYLVATVALTVSIGAMRAVSELAYGVRGYRRVSLVEVGVAVAQVVVPTGLWMVDRLSTVTAIIAMAVPYAVGAAMMGRRLGFVPRRRWTSVHLRSLVADGFSSMGGAAAHYMAVRSNRLIIAGALGVRSAGEFAVAVTLPETLRLVPRAVSQVLGDRLRSGALTPGAARRPLVGGLVGYVILQGIVALVGPPLVVVVFGSAFTDVSAIIPVLALAECLVAISLVCNGLLRGAAHPSRIGLPDVTGAVVAVVGTAWAVGRWGVTGAAWAGVGGAATMALVAVFWTMASLRHSSAREWGR